jgi:predicted DNA-binding antitoxin AbrB/MazE fold protein
VGTKVLSIINQLNQIKMTITIKTEVTREVLESVFITALEGGSNYWYFLSEEACALVDAAVPRDGSKALSERIFEAVYDKGVIIPIHDIEDPEGEPIGALNINTFQQALNECSEKSSWAIQSEMAEQGDATSSDVVFQYLALGEIVYG